MHIGTTQTHRGIPLYALLETMTSDPHAAHFNLPDLTLMMRSQVYRVIRHNLCKLQQ
jgi:hypothetical protein